MKERPPIWRVAANILNKQSRTDDKGCSSRMRVGRGANNVSRQKKNKLRNTHKARCFLWRQNNPEVNYSPTRISGGGGGGVFIKEFYPTNQRKRDILLGTWNVRRSWLRIGTGGGHL
jgi:hypothetical protein